ncbi:MAG: Uma2 family endonuclease [Synechococcales bacterium]|nr:Uma2 family endonuclease [Synechococcales bacterium]
MTVTSTRFSSLEEYLSVAPSELPEGSHEYWDGELIPIMPESIENLVIARYLFLMLIAAGVPFQLICPHSCEIVVAGRPRTRIPDLVVLLDVHLQLLKQRATLTPEMPPPTLVAEVVSPGGEESENYQRDYVQKLHQYADCGIPEYWLIDPMRQVVWVFNLQAETYQRSAFRGDQAIVSPQFPKVSLTAAQLLSAGGNA